MKYHHLERCFTYRMKRPMVIVVSGLRTVKVWDYGWPCHFHGRRRGSLSGLPSGALLAFGLVTS
jgi:hypothetical protein